MKAAYLTGHGGVDKFVYGDLPDPVAGPGEVVVDVHAASVNAADYKVRLGGGAYSGASNLNFPYILGRDFSGTVAARGPGVTDFAVGDPVFGVMDAGIEGCYAEKIKIAAAIIARKPDSLDHERAPAGWPALRSSSPNISARPSSPLPARVTTIMCASSALTGSSTTIARISQ